MVFFVAVWVRKLKAPTPCKTFLYVADSSSHVNFFQTCIKIYFDRGMVPSEKPKLCNLPKNLIFFSPEP